MTGTSEQAKRTARAFYESYAGRDLDASFERYIASDLINHGMGGAYDRATWLAFEKTALAAFPDLQVEVLDQVAEGDKVATRWRLGGAHTGAEFAGVPARGNTAFIHATAVDRVADGQIVEHWVDLDFTAWVQALAADPS